jgi:hypothetical protein
MAYQYIISKYVSLFLHPHFESEVHLTHSRSLDPVFAISIGLAAALTRIRREEKEEGRTVAETVDVFKRRAGSAWEGVWRKE